MALLPRSGTFAEFLSIDERALIENASCLLQASNPELLKLQFWGKIFATDCDYLIVEGLVKSESFNESYPDKVFYYCTNQTYKLKPLPIGNDSAREGVELTGVASTEIDPATEEVEEEDGTVVPATPAFLEVHQLGLVVKQIDQNTNVVPKGAVVVDPSYNVVENVLFRGLDAAAAMDENSYFHFRKPADEASARDSDGYIQSVDFLDKITSTHPSGSWSIVMNPSKSTVVLRSLIYPGYVFYHDIGTKNYGGMYVGYGKKNEDIAFML